MVRPAGESKAKNKGSAAKKGTARQAAKGDGSSAASSRRKVKAGDGMKAKRRVSDDQIREQLKMIKYIKERLKDVVDRYEDAYPEGVDFAPSDKDC